MLGGLRGPSVACVAGGRDSHQLQPGPSRETLVEGLPDPGANLLRTGVVPDLGDHLRGGGVPEVEVVDELDDSR
ncbi:unnamed protein product [Sphagnum troendelagicum]|uniref:Uncharacterized protein n=1 Tax=Sphagnum troendelagicum TaxID=128251 RepID=A0ABP0TPD4_9BRYO